MISHAATLAHLFVSADIHNWVSSFELELMITLCVPVVSWSLTQLLEPFYSPVHANQLTSADRKPS